MGRRRWVRTGPSVFGLIGSPADRAIVPATSATVRRSVTMCSANAGSLNRVKQWSIRSTA